MVKLKTDLSYFIGETNKLDDLLSNINVDLLPPKYSKMVTEIIMLRLFDLLQTVLKSVAMKIVCGAPYVDGSNPLVLRTARSLAGAESSMRTYGRTTPRYTLRWTEVDEIKKNIEKVVEPGDHYLTALDRNKSFIEEMRWVRNRVAHNNTRARDNYKKAIVRHYGAYVRSITPGTLLLTNRIRPILMEQYLIKSRILVRQLVKG